MKRYRLLAACCSALLCFTTLNAVSEESPAGSYNVMPGEDIEIEGDSSIELTARWGVRVIITDDSGNELLNTVAEVSDGTGTAVGLPDVPEKEGITFVGWQQIDSNGGSAYLSEDSSAVYVNGPGPIILTALYSESGNGELISQSVLGYAEESSGQHNYLQTGGSSSLSKSNKTPMILPPTDVSPKKH